MSCNQNFLLLKLTLLRQKMACLWLLGGVLAFNSKNLWGKSCQPNWWILVRSYSWEQPSCRPGVSCQLELLVCPQQLLRTLGWLNLCVPLCVPEADLKKCGPMCTSQHMWSCSVDWLWWTENSFSFLEYRRLWSQACARGFTRWWGWPLPLRREQKWAE